MSGHEWHFFPKGEIWVQPVYRDTITSAYWLESQMLKIHGGFTLGTLNGWGVWMVYKERMVQCERQGSDFPHLLGTEWMIILWIKGPRQDSLFGLRGLVRRLGVWDWHLQINSVWMLMMALPKKHCPDIIMDHSRHFILLLLTLNFVLRHNQWTMLW